MASIDGGAANEPCRRSSRRKKPEAERERRLISRGAVNRPMPIAAATSAEESSSELRWSELLNQARGGSRDAQAELLAAVRPYLLAAANREVGSDLRPKLAASDVVQNATGPERDWACSVRFRGISRTDTRAELWGWLRTIVRNRLAELALAFGEIGRMLGCTESAARQVGLVAIKRLGRELHCHGHSEI